MKEIKIVAKHNIFGHLGHQIFTDNKVYKAWQVYPDDELWIVESDFVVNELPTYDWNFIQNNFEMIDERRDRNINKILNNC